MKHKKRRYHNNDKSIPILTPAEVTKSPRQIGYLGGVKHTEWKKASPATLEEMFEKGALNEYQIQMLEEAGFDVVAASLKHKLEDIDLDNPDDFLAFAKIAKESPAAINVMNDIEMSRKKERLRKKTMDLKKKIMSMDMDSPAGVKAFAELTQSDPDAFAMFEKLQKSGKI